MDVDHTDYKEKIQLQRKTMNQKKLDNKILQECTDDPFIKTI